MPPPPSQPWDEEVLEEGRHGRGGDPAPDVAASMRQFIETLTTPETDLEHKLMGEVKKWMERHEPLPSVPLPSQVGARCPAGSGAANAQGSSSGSAGSAGTVDRVGRSSSDGSSASSSGRSEEGTSAAWRLCAWLQRAGWPAQHCASIRTGSSSNGGSSGGWQFCSGHEFLLLHPDLCTVGRATGSAASSSSDDDSGGGGDMRMRDTGAPLAAAPPPPSALVVDPEFSTQFALASPTPRYAVLVSLLPRAFVGSYARLQQLVEWVCCEMRASFQAAGSGLPPWRSLAHVLNKWRLEEGDAEAAPPPADAPPLPTSFASWGKGEEQRGAYQPHMSGDSGGVSAAAFSLEQQDTMRQLLLHQALQAAPSQRQALTASSSASSMDGASPGPPPPHISRSLLAREMGETGQSEGQQSAKPAWQPSTSQRWGRQGPAAAILGIMAQGGSV